MISIFSKRILPLILATLLLPAMCGAAVYLDGSATDCLSGDTDYAPATRSCGAGSDTVYLTLSTFASGLTPGTTNHMRAGDYFADGANDSTGALAIVSGKSGTEGNPTILKAYPGEERQVVIGTATREATYNSNPSDATGAGSWLYYPSPAVSITAASYVTIDGIKTYGSVYFVSGHDLVLQNSDIGGGGPSGNQGNTIRLNQVYSTSIKNNLLHDNCRRVESNDGSIFIGYEFTAMIEGNTFYDGYGNNLENKDARYQSGRTTEIKNNFFAYSSNGPTSTGVLGYNQYSESANVLIHHNIFYKLTRGYNVVGTNPTNSHVVYNNTFIDCDIDIASVASGGPFPLDVYNNIFYHPTTGDIFLELYGLTWLSAADWNIYYNTANWNKSAPGGEVWETTLSGWKTFSSMDANSISSDPDFVNASGTTAVDFKRSSYSENFTGSPYSTKAGVYEIGDELIGFTATGIPSGQASLNGTAGAALDGPQNLTIQ